MVWTSLEKVTTSTETILIERDTAGIEAKVQKLSCL